MYTEKVMDHFEHPRNVGELENPSGMGTVGNAKCGDIMRIYLDIDETESWLEICVANPSEYLKEEQILEIFKAGKSTKGQNRGLGLSKIKDYEKHYGFDILVENKKVNTRNWIYFTIKLSTRISSGK